MYEGREAVAKRFDSPGIFSRQDPLPFFLPQGSSLFSSKAEESFREKTWDWLAILVFPGIIIPFLERDGLLVSLFYSFPSDRVHSSLANADGGQWRAHTVTFLPFLRCCLHGTNQRMAVSHRCAHLVGTQRAWPSFGRECTCREFRGSARLHSSRSPSSLGVVRSRAQCLLVPSSSL